MPYSPGGIRVNPNGQTAVVTFTLPGGGTPIAYSSQSGAGTVSLPATITTTTDFWFAERTTVTVSALVNGAQQATSSGTTAAVDLSGGGLAGLTVAPPSIATGTYSTFVVHGSTAGTSRPTSTGPVLWIGSVTPTNATAGDEWRDTTTDPYTVKVRGTSAFSPLTGTSVAPARTKILLVGTSLQALSGTGPETLDAASPGTDAVQARGAYHWLNAYLHQAFTLALNGGISGSMSSAQLAALPASLATADADVVWIDGPVNDIANDISAATTIANLAAMLDLCRGKKVIVTTCSPSSSYNTTGRRQALATVNDYIRGLTQSRATSDVRVVDVWPLIADPATGSPATGMTSDGIVHYSPWGAERIGRAVATAVESWFPAHPPRVLGLLDPYNVCGNPHFGTSGSGWSALNGPTVAYSAAEDRGSNQAVLSWSGVSDASGQAVQYVEPISNARYAVGDVVQLSARLRWAGLVPVGTSGIPCMPYLRLTPRIADNSFPSAAFAFAVAGSEVPAVSTFPSSGDMIAITSRLTIPATTQNLYMAVGWAGAASCTSLTVTDVVVRKGA